MNYLAGVWPGFARGMHRFLREASLILHRDDDACAMPTRPTPIARLLAQIEALHRQVSEVERLGAAELDGLTGEARASAINLLRMRSCVGSICADFSMI